MCTKQSSLTLEVKSRTTGGSFKEKFRAHTVAVQASRGEYCIGVARQMGRESQCGRRGRRRRERRGAALERAWAAAALPAAVLPVGEPSVPGDSIGHCRQARERHVMPRTNTQAPPRVAAHRPSVTSNRQVGSPIRQSRFRLLFREQYLDPLPGQTRTRAMPQLLLVNFTAIYFKKKIQSKFFV